jgi:hypothetical protein
MSSPRGTPYGHACQIHSASCGYDALASIRPAYLNAQRPNAEKTVREFARKWMLEQGKKTELRIDVAFGAPDPL